MEPTGLLVEDNGAKGGAVVGGPVNGTGVYQNALGAGTGAVGPGSPLDTSALVGAQYLGFIYSAGFTTQSK